MYVTLHYKQATSMIRPSFQARVQGCPGQSVKNVGLESTSYLTFFYRNVMPIARNI
jgi:hypothetical protein